MNWQFAGRKGPKCKLTDRTKGELNIETLFSGCKKAIQNQNWAKKQTMLGVLNTHRRTQGNAHNYEVLRDTELREMWEHS